MRECLIVVDYQKDFVSGSLGFPAAAALEQSIAEKIQQYHERGEMVIFTFDTHTKQYLQTQEGRNLPVEHCIQGTEGWELFGAVAQSRLPQDLCIEKPAFPSWRLGEILREQNFQRLELVGVVTDICVIANAVIAKAALPEAEITVDAACTAALTPEMKEKALDVMESMQIHVTNRTGANAGQ